MNPTRLTNHCPLPLGIVAALIVLAVWSTACTLTPTPPPASPGTTLAAVASPAPLASATPTLKPAPTLLVIQHPTEVPLSWFAVTVNIAATATDLKVGNTVTVTVTTKSTGQRVAGRAYCRLNAWLADETHSSALSDPILEPWDQSTDLDLIRPGDVKTCTFTLRAVRPGTVFLEGGYGGKAYVSDYERDIGEKSPLLEIHVRPTSP